VYGWKPYHLHVPTVLKCGSLNLLEPSRPALACNGIALPLPYSFLLEAESTPGPWCGRKDYVN
jgi:hypothetical protein